MLNVKIKAYFVNLNLKDLPEGQLKNDVLNSSRTFYWLKFDVDKLREGAKVFLSNRKNTIRQ